MHSQPNNDTTSKYRAKKAVILWANYFEELTAITFCHEFLEMGIATTTVAIHSRDDLQRGHILTPACQTLAETVAQADTIDCLIIPASGVALGHFQEDPLLWKLIDAVHSKAGYIVMGSLEPRPDAEIARLLPPVFRIIQYPKPEHLLIFARRLAHQISTGKRAEAGRERQRKQPPLIRVANGSDPASVAGAIAGVIREYGFAEAQSVGVSAGHQMLKAAAIARQYLQAEHLSLFAVPDFSTVHIDGHPRSAIRLYLSVWPKDMDSQIDPAHLPTHADAEDVSV